MQKLELKRNLSQLIIATKSNDIINLLENKVKNPNGYSEELVTLLINSKFGFDQSILNSKQKEILNQFNAVDFYNTQSYATLIRYVSVNDNQRTNDYLRNSKDVNDFYSYHKTLMSTYGLIDNLLFQDKSLKESSNIVSYKEAENNGFLSFEIISENNIEFENYTNVIVGINTLVSVVTSIFEKLDNLDNLDNLEKSKLILADSGSNTVLSIKLPKEISKSIAKIMDEAWIFISNRNGHELNKLNKNLKESLSIISKIDKAEKDELISLEQSGLWKKNIADSTEKIIMNNTLTKSKSEEISILSNQKLLPELTKKYLTLGE
jgi:hypothetical protein